jgi:hypothetical protein
LKKASASRWSPITSRSAALLMVQFVPMIEIPFHRGLDGENTSFRHRAQLIRHARLSTKSVDAGLSDCRQPAPQASPEPDNAVREVNGTVNGGESSI